MPINAATNIAEYKSSVEAGARALIAARPQGFTFSELAAHLQYRGLSIKEERRLRRQLDRLCDEDIAYRVDDGIFVAGPRFSEPSRDVAGAVDAAFWNAGGILSKEELWAQLADDGFGRSEITRYLANSGRYELGIPFDGYRLKWCVPDENRKAIPMPGKNQMLELSLLRARKGPVPFGWGVGQLKAFRARVGLAIRDARAIAEINIETLSKDWKLLRAVADCISTATNVQPWHPDTQDRFSSYAEWWADAVTRDGEADAFVQAWIGLEEDDHFLTGLLAALDVPCWAEIGRALNVDPALVSRGALGPPPSVSAPKKDGFFGNEYR